MNLLNVDANPKTIKGQKKGYMTAILYMAPWKLSGYQVCPMAELAGCVADCLNTAGCGGMAPSDADVVNVDGVTVKLNNIQRARIARTKLFFEDRKAFFDQLRREIDKATKKATKNNMVLVVRLNGTSDIRWEKIHTGLADNIFQEYPNIQFYDYTKIPNRKNLPSNYHLTFSYSARTEFNNVVEKALQNYGDKINLAVVFGGKKLPETFLGRKVVNADESDLRFIDPVGTVAGLIAKGKAKKSNSGFVVQGV